MSQTEGKGVAKVPLVLPAAFEDASAVSRYVARFGDGKESLLLLPPHQRSQALATLNSEYRNRRLQKQGKCERCMFKLDFCICSFMHGLREEVSLAAPYGVDVHFVVWMHVMERRRASNTGKLLEHLLPRSEVLCHDVPGDERRLRELVARADGRAFVLYPSAEAVTVSDVLAAAPAVTGDSGPLPFLVVLLDGTWRQANRMQRPMVDLHLPHVALSTTAQSEFYWRRQTQEGRICTIEAAALLLDEMGQASAGVAVLLRRALATLNDALERQCHYDSFAHGPPPPEPSAKKRGAVQHRLPKRAPGERGLLAAAAET